METQLFALFASPLHVHNDLVSILVVMHAYDIDFIVMCSYISRR